MRKQKTAFTSMLKVGSVPAAGWVADNKILLKILNPYNSVGTAQHPIQFVYLPVDQTIKAAVLPINGKDKFNFNDTFTDHSIKTFVFDTQKSHNYNR